MLFLNLLARYTLPSLSETFSISTGPLIASMLFFFAPALLLGSLSPYAVKLQSLQRSKVGVGEVAGQIFFWSTLGSILGSLAAGFILIPSFSVNTILVVTSLFLCALGLVPLAIMRVLRLENYVAAAISSIVIAGYSFMGLTQSGITYERSGVYEKITVYESTHSNGRPIRVLLQDRSNSGAIYVDELDPVDLAYGYAEYYALALELVEETNDALVIGAGMYSYPRALQHADEDIIIDVVDIEPGLEELAQDFFNLDDKSRINSFVNDGRKFLIDSDKTYDIIFGDAFSTVNSIPTHLSTKEFYELVQSRMSPGGLYTMNLHGKLKQSNDSITLSQYKTLKSVFDYVYIFAVDDPNSSELQNLTAVAMDNPIDFNILRSSQDSFVSSVKDSLVDFSIFDVSEQILLTDDYAPVDHLSLKLIDI